MIGWAQGGGEEIPNDERLVVDDTPPDDPGTDDPEGREPVTASSVVDSGETRPNWDRVADDARPPTTPAPTSDR
jgi:hypothetical protein